jgi:hypothetical protein
MPDCGNAELWERTTLVISSAPSLPSAHATRPDKIGSAGNWQGNPKVTGFSYCYN